MTPTELEEIRMNEARIRAMMAEHDQLWLEAKPLYDKIEEISVKLFDLQKMIREEDPDCVVSDPIHLLFAGTYET